MSDQDIGRLWTLITHVHALAGPVTMLLYPLYASVMAIESPSKVDDEQWLAYWILYSFLTLMEMLLQPILQWGIPIWYDIKLAFVAWLVLPQFRGATVIYEMFVREKIRKYGKSKGKNKFVDFITPKKRARGLLKKKGGEGSTFFSLRACLDILVSNITLLHTSPFCFALVFCTNLHLLYKFARHF
ncbi:unnamed protein product [Camellia sinensis]